MTMAVTALGVHLLHGSDLTNQGLGAGVAAAALTLGVPAARSLGTERGRRRLGSRLGGLFEATGRLFDFRRGFKPTTALYAVLTPLFFGAGVAYLAAPVWTLENIMGYVLKGRDSSECWGYFVCVCVCVVTCCSMHGMHVASVATLRPALGCTLGFADWLLFACV